MRLTDAQVIGQAGTTKDSSRLEILKIFHKHLVVAQLWERDFSTTKESPMIEECSTMDKCSTMGNTSPWMKLTNCFNLDVGWTLACFNTGLLPYDDNYSALDLSRKLSSNL